MASGHARNTKNISFSPFLDMSSLFPFRKPRTHQYDCSKLDVEFVFELVEGDATRGYMTSQKRGVRKGDCIILQQEGAVVKYQVEKIDYYSSPADMWIALLRRLG